MSEVGRAAVGVSIEVVDEFLGQHSHKLRVEARLMDEVGVVRRRSSGGGSTAALGARTMTMGSELQEAILRS